MKKLIWLLCIVLPLSAQTGKRERPDRRGTDRRPAAAVEEKALPGEESSGRARGDGAFRRFAVVLDQPAAGAAMTSRKEISSELGRQRLAAVENSQGAVRQLAASNGWTEIGRSSLLLNAVFVAAPAEAADRLAAVPGVRYVREMQPMRRHMTKANDVVKAPQAWARLGGRGGAGAGIKIAILDTGIDISHPSMQDPSLTVPSGYPRCSGDACAYTNSKVIAARSFVNQLVYAYPEDTRPDDISPRDRVGHGTAAASAAAGAEVDSPLGRMSGVAPKAFLGNYKVFGSPGVNDLTFDDVIIAALEAAMLDGMDIASLSLGGASLWGPNDRGAVCGNPAGLACDLQVEVVEVATRLGLTVVVSAGNDGDIGVEIPTLSSIASPGVAPSAITVGASVNSHILYQSLRVEGAPAPLNRVNTYFGNGPRPTAPVSAVGRDVSRLQNDGKACTSLSNGSLTGAFAIIERGDCTIAVKVSNARTAGAVGVILFQNSTNGIFPFGGLQSTGIPMAFIGRDNGTALKNYVNANPSATISIDPQYVSVAEPAGEIAIFSSQGPANGTNGIKPEVVAVGADLFVATQSYDPNGDMFDITGYTRAEGTSFSGPMVAGAAALVKQRNPLLTPASIKSAIVNTADPNLFDYDYDGNRIQALQSGMGNGQLDADSAVQTNIVALPATLGFGVVNALPLSGQVRLANVGQSDANLQIFVDNIVSANGVTITATPSQVTVPPGQAATITVQIAGTLPAANWYESELRVEGAGVPFRVPFAYIVKDNQPFNVFPLTSNGFTAIVQGRVNRLNVKFVDKQGAPAAGVPVVFRAEVGGGRIEQALGGTDSLGIADAVVFAGPTLGEQVFSVEGGGLRTEFIGRAIQQPAIQTGGVVNAASGQLGNGIAPGSYISIYGAALADTTLAYSTRYLPLSLANVSVGFDVPGRQLSYPGRIHFVSPGQVNVQVPWELAGEASADIKISIGDYSSSIIRVPLNNSSPAAFEYTDSGSGRLLAAALDANYALISSGNPVARGGVAQLYANGIGPVDNTPASGEAAGAAPLSSCRTPPEILVGDRPAQVVFCGLAPGFVGLYQINAVIAQDTPTGIQPLLIRSGGVTSKASALPVR